MSASCYNPFHFVPVAARSRDQKAGDLERTDFEAGRAGAATHERYVAGTHSGRLICRLTTKTPMAVGAEQIRHQGQMGEVLPYLVGDLPAIPASSLRGLIGSLAEAASNSAARVLAGGAYSFRKPFDPKFTLSAIGLLVRQGNGRLGLKGVALPTLDLAADRNQYIVPPRFRKAFPDRPAFKVYVGDAKWIRKDNGYRTALHGQPNLDWNVPQLQYNAQKNVNADPSLHCKPKPENPKFAVSQEAAECDPRPGMMRIMGWWGERSSQLPSGKRHELWLPIPANDVPVLDLGDDVLAQFHAIADERTAATEVKGPLLPFHPAGTERNDNPDEWGNRIRLKDGDLVYFDLDENGRVKEVALSAIWRGMVKDQKGAGAGAAQFYQAVDPELIPFSKHRKTITIAERMFGFVEENEQGEGKGMALASRIRFSDGLLKPGVTAEAALEPAAVALRILSSPKPPSPALYFKGRAGGRYIGKIDLKPGEHHPLGRKMYLHHRVKPGTQPWRTRRPGENADQKNHVRPVREGQEFTFHVDFDNLTDREMGLLLYSLAPNEGFHHKLGMGKPLGLGSVKIEVLEWKAVDRMARYTLAGLRNDRYAATLRPVDAGFWKLRDEVLNNGQVSREIDQALRALGDFAGAPPAEQIHTPTLADQADPETETYKWFVANDGILSGNGLEIRMQNSFLKPIAENGGKLPTLPRPEWKEVTRDRGGRR